jgi:hypothetical protein
MMLPPMPIAMPAFAAVALLVMMASTGASLHGPPAATEQADALRVVVLEGEDAVNIVQQKTAVSNAANITMAREFSSEYQSPAGTVRQRNSETFSGALEGNVVNGIVTMSQDLTLIAPAGPGIALTGGYPAASATVTLTGQ